MGRSALDDANDLTIDGGSLRNHFLISMPGMEGTGFAHSITYICDHSPEGAMGIVVNRPLDITLGEIFKQLDIGDAITVDDDQYILSGGPVNTQRGFVLHPTEGEWQSSMKISATVSLTASRDIVSALAHKTGPQRSLFALGYAGWAPGQLEEEINDNAWLTIPADDEILFEATADERWDMAAKKLGFDPSLIPMQAGHA